MLLQAGSDTKQLILALPVRRKQPLQRSVCALVRVPVLSKTMVSASATASMILAALDGHLDGCWPHGWQTARKSALQASGRRRSLPSEWTVPWWHFWSADRSEPFRPRYREPDGLPDARPCSPHRRFQFLGLLDHRNDLVHNWLRQPTDLHLDGQLALFHNGSCINGTALGLFVTGTDSPVREAWLTIASPATTVPSKGITVPI